MLWLTGRASAILCGHAGWGSARPFEAIAASARAAGSTGRIVRVSFHRATKRIERDPHHG
jgi:hypothetical protein